MSQLAKENNVQCWTFEKALKKVLKDGFFINFCWVQKRDLPNLKKNIKLKAWSNKCGIYYSERYPFTCTLITICKNEHNFQ